MKSRAVLSIFLFLVSILYSEPISLETLMDQTDSRCLWDPLMKKGILIRGSRSVVFSTEYPLMILDHNQTVSSGSIVYSNNRVTFSEEAASIIKSHLLEKPVSSDTAGSYRIAGILIDPGHGGRDSGAFSRFPVDGIELPLKEKDLVLEVSLRLEEMLKKKFPRKEILMTRRTDIYPTLENRVKQANDFTLEEGEGIMYISIHANASLNPDASGFEVWYLPETFRRQVLNDSDDNEAILPILNTIMEEEFTLESRKLAETILENMNREISSYTPNRGLKEESWFVVRNAMMASILIETGFITNSEETERLRDPSYLKKMTEGIYNGIIDFVNFFEE